LNQAALGRSPSVPASTGFDFLDWVARSSPDRQGHHRTALETVHSMAVPIAAGGAVLYLSWSFAVLSRARWIGGIGPIELVLPHFEYRKNLSNIPRLQ